MAKRSSRKDISNISTNAVDNQQNKWSCSNCGNPVSRSEALADHRLKDKDGKFCRFCPGCSEIFEQAVLQIDDPTNMILPSGIVCDLGDRDPFFRIRLELQGEGGLPQWIVVPPEDETGGLLVFVRRAQIYLKRETGERLPKLDCQVKIIRKTERVAFAEPYIEALPKKDIEEESILIEHNEDGGLDNIIPDPDGPNVDSIPDEAFDDEVEILEGELEDLKEEVEDAS